MWTPGITGDDAAPLLKDTTSDAAGAGGDGLGATDEEAGQFKQGGDAAEALVVKRGTWVSAPAKAAPTESAHQDTDGHVPSGRCLSGRALACLIAGGVVLPLLGAGATVATLYIAKQFDAGPLAS